MPARISWERGWACQRLPVLCCTLPNPHLPLHSSDPFQPPLTHSSFIHSFVHSPRVAQGKLDTESYLQSAGVPYTSIRPVYIYGPLNYNPVEEWFFHRLKAGRPIPVPSSGMQVCRGGWSRSWRVASGPTNNQGIRAWGSGARACCPMSSAWAELLTSAHPCVSPCMPTGDPAGPR